MSYISNPENYPHTSHTSHTHIMKQATITKAFNIQKDGYLFLTDVSEIDGLLWASEDETSPDAYEEFESRQDAMDFINRHEIAEAEIVECDSLWA